MAVKKFGISVPADIGAEIEDQARRWGLNRSQTLTRIYSEWREHLRPSPAEARPLGENGRDRSRR